MRFADRAARLSFTSGELRIFAATIHSHCSARLGQCRACFPFGRAARKTFAKAEPARVFAGPIARRHRFRSKRGGGARSGHAEARVAGDNFRARVRDSADLRALAIVVVQRNVAAHQWLHKQSAVTAAQI